MLYKKRKFKMIDLVKHIFLYKLDKYILSHTLSMSIGYVADDLRCRNVNFNQKDLVLLISGIKEKESRNEV